MSTQIGKRTEKRGRDWEMFQRTGLTPERSILQAVKALERDGKVSWGELRDGDRGLDVSNVRLALRDLNLGIDVQGGYLMASKQPTTVVEALSARLVLARAGAASVTATPEDFSPMPVETEPPEMYWIDSETGAPPDQSAGEFGLVSPSLKTAIAYVDLSMLVRVITGGLADTHVNETFIRAAARGVDKAGIRGTGVDGQPSGILSVVTPGSGATFSTATAAGMLKALDEAHIEPTAWISDPASAELLRKRASNGTGSRLMVEDGRMMDLPFLVTANVPANTVLVGDFRRLTILNRSIEILVDRSSKSTQGATRVVVFWHGDIVVPHPSAFAAVSSVT